MKHMESRDPKDGRSQEIEVLLEMEMGYQLRPNDLVESIQQGGFSVHELTRTVHPRGALEMSDPGSAGSIF